MNRLLRACAGFAALLLVSGIAAHAQEPQCSGAQKPRRVAELMFGRKSSDGIGVNEVAWARFLDQEITARFPDGFTVLSGGGQWRDQISKKIIREPSRVVQIVLPGEPEDLARLNEIVEAYKGRFRQQSVAVILHRACVSF